MPLTLTTKELQFSYSISYATLFSDSSKLNYALYKSGHNHCISIYVNKIYSTLKKGRPGGNM